MGARSISLLWLLLVMFTMHSSAQPFPSKPLGLVIPQAPGGLTDVLGRAVAQRLSQKWQQPVTVENRSGGNNVIAATYVARSAPDGHTLLLASDTLLSALPLLMKNLPFDPYKDFSLVSVMAESTSILVVHAELPVNTLNEFVALAHSKRGEFNYASFGNGSPPHLDMELFKRMASIDLVHIPYTGVAPAITQMLGTGSGSLILLAGISAPLPHIRAGKLKALAIAGRQRSVLLPDVPTFLENGFTFLAGGWFGIVVPNGTPSGITETLASAVSAVIKDREFSESYIIKAGLTPVGNTPAEFAEYLREDRRSKAEKVKVSGARFE